MTHGSPVTREIFRFQIAFIRVLNKALLLKAKKEKFQSAKVDSASLVNVTSANEICVKMKRKKKT